MRSNSVSLSLLALLALGMTGLFALPAKARDVVAVATSDINMRQGPGTRYRPVLLVPRGARVSVLRCTNAYEWCEINYAARAGWVAARYLRDTRPNYDDRPVSDMGAILGLELFNFVLNELADRDRGRDDYAGGRDDDYGGGRRGPGPREVCFYEHANFRGRSFCAGSGDADRRLSQAWNDRISSIRVGRRAAVQVCEHENFGGWCETVRDDLREFRGRRNDAISSYRVLRGGGYGGGNGGGGRFGRACFFEHADFRGASICFDAGEGTARLPQQWNDRISSIRLEGRAQARVCQHENFGGWCETVRGDAARFSERHNDEISSIEVY
ncbi:peptidase inhibitor family I36 protein [Nitratireductor soli]|uniref:peptidase inhibitor family I36 protein n=1 Tax=Nitratireductor soli TaxID=1670619 RepID=UPI00065DC6A3|nr:peptidase inhibitor family I36 protein [Nitratireductor soli]